MYTGPHVKYPLFLSDLNENNFFDRFPKNTHIKFHENLSSGR